MSRIKPYARARSGDPAERRKGAPATLYGTLAEEWYNKPMRKHRLPQQRGSEKWS